MYIYTHKVICLCMCTYGYIRVLIHNYISSMYLCCQVSREVSTRSLMDFIFLNIYFTKSCGPPDVAKGKQTLEPPRWTLEVLKWTLEALS